MDNETGGKGDILADKIEAWKMSYSIIHNNLIPHNIDETEDRDSALLEYDTLSTYIILNIKHLLNKDDLQKAHLFLHFLFHNEWRRRPASTFNILTRHHETLREILDRYRFDYSVRRKSRII